MSEYQGLDDHSIITIEDKPVDDVRWRSVTVVVADDGLKYSFDADGDAICGAKKRNGGPCVKPPMNGRNRCQLHGGKSLRGVAHPRFKHGIYSKDVIGKVIGDRYETMRNDDSLIQLRDDIAIASSRISQVLSTIESGESLASWDMLQKTYDDFKAAHVKRDAGEVAYLLTYLGNIIADGVAEQLKWQEIFEVQGHKRRMIETERKRMSDLQQMMTSEQAMVMLAFVVSVFKKRTRELVTPDVADELLAAVTQDISSYLSSKKSFVNMQDSD